MAIHHWLWSLATILVLTIVFGFGLKMLRPSSPSVPGLLASDQIISVAPWPKVCFQAREGQIAFAEFAVQNISDKEIKLLGFNSECTCATIMDDFPIALKPGAQVKLTVRVKVGHPDAEGKVVRRTVLLVNSKGTVPMLTLEATVLSPTTVGERE